ncbi:MAG: cache domain-containing protein, partial [Nitrospiraceae bacterium]
MPTPSSGAADRRSYVWLPVLIVGMTIVAFVIGAVMLRSIEVRLVEATGENLTLASAEIADKLDRLMFERYGDIQMMARAFSGRTLDKRFIDEYLRWMKSTYSPMYIWLGVTDKDGRLITATDSSIIGQDHAKSGWFEAVVRTGKVQVNEVETHEPNNTVEAIAFTAPLIGLKGEFLGVVTSRIGLAMLEDVLIETVREIQNTDKAAGPFEYQFLTKEGMAFVDSAVPTVVRANLKRVGLPSALLSDSGTPGYVEEQHVRRSVNVVTGYSQTKGY